MMKKFTYFLLFAFLWQNSFSQEIQFEQVIPLSSVDAFFKPAGSSSATAIDIDNDGDMDVIISGSDDGDILTRLYTNDGAGNFTQITDTPFVGVTHGSVIAFDADNDGDQDVLITGYSGSGSISKLYSNDGTGTFTEVVGTPFIEVEGNFTAVSDVDNDGDQDVLITGYSDSGRISKLYTNDGTGTFTEVTDTPFTGISGGAVAFADVDADGDQDVLIAGRADLDRIAQLYVNDGTGTFTEVTDTPFTGVSGGSVSFADVDADSDLDVLITGDSNSGRISKLYTNDGTGAYTEVSDTSFEPVEGSSAAFSDLDNDGDLDVLITGYSDSDEIPKLYLNDGNGVFTKVSDTLFESVEGSSIVFFDIDADGDTDVLIAGYPNSITYLNDGSADFTKNSKSFFTGVYDGSVAFSDIDNDGDTDVLITGYSDLGYISKLYNNDGTGIFTERNDTSFVQIYKGVFIGFSDIDNDGDQDVLITGDSGSGKVSKLYTNDGTGVFTEVSATPFEGVYYGSVAFSDVDNDGDQDVLITGSSDSGRIAKLYTNDGTGVFTEVTGIPFVEVSYSSVAFSDVDNDDDADVLITGDSDSGKVSKLYTNDGTGVFTEVIDTSFVGVEDSSVAFSDVDNDGDADVLITGYSDSGMVSKLYTNDGTGVFTEVIDTPFVGVEDSSVAFSDVDNDGDQDVLITGYFSDMRYSLDSSGGTSKLYSNDGTGVFTEVSDTPFEGVEGSSVAFSDVDNDGDTDVLITGNSDDEGAISYLYRNLSYELGISEPMFIDNVQVYPNPGLNIFTVKADSPVQDILLYNLQGQEMPFLFDQTLQQIKVNYPKGIYLLKLKIDNRIYSQKLIVK